MEIQLTQGKVAIIDYMDRGLVAGLTFHAVRVEKQWYAATTIDGERHYLHHIIVGKPKRGFVVDHRDRDGLNNRRANLHHVTKGMNTRNADLRSDNKSGYKGVSPTTSRNKWRATIRINGERIHLGYYHDPAEAHAAYLKAADHYGVAV